jgi:hypothetical protein
MAREKERKSACSSPSQASLTHCCTALLYPSALQRHDRSFSSHPEVERFFLRQCRYVLSFVVSFPSRGISREEEEEEEEESE